jgi:hypothetical protein
VVVAAVPFLEDKDIRSVAPSESYDDKIELGRDRELPLILKV